jgi:RimJ/RimL family protein N-acetyltransferase
LRLSVPPEGIRAGNVILRFPSLEDVDYIGNTASERVVDRAGFTREGVFRSMPKPDGGRVDKTLYSLLPGE